MSFGQRIIRLGGYSERLYSFRRVVLNQDMPRPDDLDISCQPRYVKGTSAGNIAQVIHNDDGIQPSFTSIEALFKSAVGIVFEF